MALKVWESEKQASKKCEQEVVEEKRVRVMATFDQRGQHVYGNQYNTEKNQYNLMQPLVERGKKQIRREKTVTILCLAANPKDTTPLRLGEEMRTIDMALHQTEFREMFDIKQCPAVRVTDLQSCLLRHEPDIVHFSGHGSKYGEILLEDGDGYNHPVSPDTLGQTFSLLKENIQCVVLNACYSEQQAQAIAQHIDCVIGMSKAIEDMASIGFAKAFYQALGYGKDVKVAFDLGCLQVKLEHLGEQHTPELLAFHHNPATIRFVNS